MKCHYFGGMNMLLFWGTLCLSIKARQCSFFKTFKLSLHITLLLDHMLFMKFETFTGMNDACVMQANFYVYTSKLLHIGQESYTHQHAHCVILHHILIFICLNHLCNVEISVYLNTFAKIEWMIGKWTWNCQWLCDICINNKYIFN